MNPQELMPLVSKIEMFSKIPWDILTSILVKSSLIRVPENTLVIKEGEIRDYFYILLDGVALVHVKTEEGYSIQLNRLTREGTYFGEMALLGRKPGVSSANVTAVTPLHLLKLSQADLHLCFSIDLNLKKKIAAHTYHTLIANIKAEIEHDILINQLVDSEMQYGSIHSLQANDIIYVQGDPRKYACIVLSGLVNLVKQADDREVVFYTLRKGAIFGDINISDDTTYSMTAKMAQPGKLMILTESELNALLLDEPMVFEMGSTLEYTYYSDRGYVTQYSNQIMDKHALISHYELKDGREMVTISVLAEDIQYIKDLLHTNAKSITYNTDERIRREIFVHNHLIVGAKTNGEWPEWDSVCDMIFQKTQLKPQDIAYFKKTGSFTPQT